MEVTCSTLRVSRISGLCAVKVEYFAGGRDFPKQPVAAWFFAFTLRTTVLLVTGQAYVKRYVSVV
jgi:hypothetical protein